MNLGAGPKQWCKVVSTVVQGGFNSGARWFELGGGVQTVVQTVVQGGFNSGARWFQQWCKLV